MLQLVAATPGSPGREDQRRGDAATPGAGTRWGVTRESPQSRSHSFTPPSSPATLSTTFTFFGRGISILREFPPPR